MSSALSGVIRNYTLLSQQIELQQDKARLGRLDQIKQKWQRPAKKEKKKKEKESQSSESKAESIRKVDEHRISWQEFFTRFNINAETFNIGLTKEDAIKRNLEEGDNCLPEPKQTPWYIKLFHEFTTFFSLLLWAGAIISFIAYGLSPADPSTAYLGAVLIVVILFTGVITYMQNAKSDAIMEGFKNFIPQTCDVIRNGKEENVLALKIVRGDILLIKEGQRIPADIRIINSSEMKVDNSSLTGESEPLLRSDKCDQPDKLLETKNVAFFGTLCKSGSGKGVVFNIGEMTVIGQIAGLVEGSGSDKTPLRMEIDRFIVLITIIALTFGIVFFCLGFILHYTAIQNLIFAIGIITANVPEGLPPTITIALAVAAKRLSRREVLVKNLESVETLGSTSCICSDKTGTLTQNIMTVEHIWYNLKIRHCDSMERFPKTHEFEYDPKEFHFSEIHKSAVLNTEAVFLESLPTKDQENLKNLQETNPVKYPEEKARIEREWAEKLKTMPYFQREVKGDASETALIKFFQPIADIRETRNKYKIARQFDNEEAKIGFNSSWKYALKIYEIENDPEHSFVVYIKGAPEKIWIRCQYNLADGKEIEINDEIEKDFATANKLFAKNGERVFGFARKLLKKSEYPPGYQFNVKDAFNLPFKAFCFTGLISLIDPPKITVPDAIEKCKSANIKVIMVTGDQKLTAASIAKKIGIFEGKHSLDIAEEEGISHEQAIEISDAIVVDGDMLTQAAKEDEGLPENEKGKKLEKWLKKSQIVFARTSPAQKLYIVKGCQKLGHIVAVTGDGVNDSPAIKQADIGISMGITGSDVAKDSADMILLNDDFSAIVVGIEEGRRIFDNLKKTIAYMLTSNVPELLAFLIFIILAIPLPLSTILILCISVGTDIFPAIGLGFEEAELDIMTRLPRSPSDHLVSRKLIVYSYCQVGIISTASGFICYLLILNDFGFSPKNILGISTTTYFPHNLTDRYDPNAPFLGNTNLYCDGGTLTSLDTNSLRTSQSADGLVGYTVDWIYSVDITQDLRLGYLSNTCNSDGTFAPVGKSSVPWKSCDIFQLSPVSGMPVCYTTEASKYAQTAFFIANCFCQFTNSINSKAKRLPFFTQPLGNPLLILGWITEFWLAVLITYVRPLNTAFGTRDVIFLHFAVYGLFFSILMLVYDETRKFLIRNYPRRKGIPNWFERNTAW